MKRIFLLCRHIALTLAVGVPPCATFGEEIEMRGKPASTVVDHFQKRYSTLKVLAMVGTEANTSLPDMRSEASQPSSTSTYKPRRGGITQNQAGVTVYFDADNFGEVLGAVHQNLAPMRCNRVGAAASTQRARQQMSCQAVTRSDDVRISITRYATDSHTSALTITPGRAARSADERSGR